MRVLVIIFLCFFITSNFVYSQKEHRIAYAEGRWIKIIDLNGNIIEEIKLPREIEDFTFTKDRKIIAYMERKGRHVFLFNLENKAEIRITKGPYIFKEKKFYGNEKYSYPTISPDGKYLAFCIEPEYYWEEDFEEPEYDVQLAGMGILDIKKRIFYPVTDCSLVEGRLCWSPNGKKIASNPETLVLIFHIEEKTSKEISLDECIAPIRWIDNYTLILEGWDCATGGDRKIYRYNIKSAKKELIIDLTKILDSKKGIYYTESISKELNYCIIEEIGEGGKYNIFVLDIKKRKITKIVETKKFSYHAKFLDE